MTFVLLVALSFSVLVFFLLLVLTPKRIAQFIAPSGGSFFATIDGVKIHYQVEGSGPDILLLHGIAANLYCWRFLVPLLSKHHRVWALDLKGFGQSEKPHGADYGLEAQSKAVSDFIKDIIGAPCTIVGNSMGGAISLEVAMSFPKLVRKLVLIAPAYDPQVVWLDPRNYKFVLPFSQLLANQTFVKSLVKTLYGKKMEISPEVVDAYLAPYHSDMNSRRALFEAFAALTDPTLKERMRKIEKPTLFIWGAKDRLVSVSLAESARERIPHSQLAIHPTAGHHLQEEEPEWLAEKILGF